jgi:hypothetical protein
MVTENSPSSVLIETRFCCHVDVGAVLNLADAFSTSDSNKRSAASFRRDF